MNSLLVDGVPRSRSVDTSVSALLYLVLLVVALGSVRAMGEIVQPVTKQPVATFVALALVGVPTLLQLTVAPELLERLQRDPDPIGRGQRWRLVSALVVQDAGVLGAAFNLAALAVVGIAAERVWGTRRWVLIAVLSGVGSELWGLVVQPVGAGNSVVVFGLAASLASVAVRSGPRKARGLGALVLTIALVLLATGDIHGGAATIGAVLGLVLWPIPSPGRATTR